MTNIALQIKVKERLNKLDSYDYENIQCWQIQEAFNKAQLDWIRKQMYGFNSRKEGGEQSSGLVDDINVLLTTALLQVNNTTEYAECPLPSNYLYYNRVDCYAITDCCPKRRLTVYEVEESNISILLNSQNLAPNFEWSETLCTILGTNLRVYSNKDFNITDVTLVYYRLPRNIEILGCIDIETGGIYSADVNCEFKDDVAEIFVEETVKILSGDIESQLQMQRSEQNIERQS
jgi:hypothetical protein